MSKENSQAIIDIVQVEDNHGLSNVVEIQNKGQHILEVELTVLTNGWNKEKYIF